MDSGDKQPNKTENIKNLANYPKFFEASAKRRVLNITDCYVVMLKDSILKNIWVKSPNSQLSDGI